MKNNFISGLILGLLSVALMGAVYNSGGGSFSASQNQIITGNYEFNPSSATFIGDEDSSSLPFVTVINQGNGFSNLGIQSNGTGGATLHFLEGTTERANIQYNQSGNYIGIQNTEYSGSNASIRLTASGNFQWHDGADSDHTLTLLKDGGVQYRNFTVEPAAGAGFAILYSTDVTGSTSSSLYVVDEADTVNKLSGNASFQAVVISSGPVSLALISAATLQAQFPLVVGETYFNTDSNFPFVSTGTGLGQWAAMDDRTVGP